MRVLSAVALFLASFGAILGSVPAAAEGTAPTVALSVGWGGADGAGGGAAANPSWIPFTAVVKVPGGRQDWTGRLVIRPRTQTQTSSSGYEETITVRAGTTRTITVYGVNPRSGPTSFEAALVDSSGQRAVSDLAAIRPAYVAVGVLSDAAAGSALLRGVAIGPTNSQGLQVRGNHFEKGDSFPASSVELSGLHALVLNDFDSATLSQAQARAIQDYVGFGGSLILGGGAGWRRTFAQLPDELVPMRPTSTASASLNNVMDLVGGTAEVNVPVATGPLATGARLVLSDASGVPLLVETTYGSGRVVELTFDPALDPVVGTALGFQIWAQTLNRAIPSNRLPNAGVGKAVPVPVVTPRFTPPPAVPNSGTGGTQTGVATAPAGGPANVPTSRPGSSFEGQVYEALFNSPASALPPLGLLGILLIGYVLLAGPANYLWVRAMRRRELTWVTVPLIALLFTGGAYTAGVAYRGTDFLVNEIQVLKLAPGGSVDAAFFDILFAPRRGDFLVQAPEGALAATGALYQQNAALADQVELGRKPVLALNGFQVWGQRNFMLEMTAHPGVNLETHLSLAGGRIRGSVVNRGSLTVSNAALLTISGEWAPIGTLAPGATVQVDSPLGRIPAYSSGGGACPTSALADGSSEPQYATCMARSGPLVRSSQVTLAEVAAGTGVMDRPDFQALVGTIDPLPGVTVQDHAPTRHSIAAIGKPVLLETLDTLPGGWAVSRLVIDSKPFKSIVGPTVEVRDYDLPGQVTGPLALEFGIPGIAVPIKGVGPQLPGQGAASVEVYDWSRRSWTTLSERQACTGSTLYCHPLSSGEMGAGIVRVRTHSTGTSNLRVQLATPAGAA